MRPLILALLLLVLALRAEATVLRRVKRGQHRLGSPVNLDVDVNTVVSGEPQSTVIRKRIEFVQNPSVVHKYMLNYGGDLSNIDLSKLKLGGVKVIQGEPIVHKYTMKQVRVVPGMEQEVFNIN